MGQSVSAAGVFERRALLLSESKALHARVCDWREKASFESGGFPQHILSISDHRRFRSRDRHDHCRWVSVCFERRRIWGYEKGKREDQECGHRICASFAYRAYFADSQSADFETRPAFASDVEALDI